MPDISMCVNDKCKVNKDCYRYMAIPSSWQSYADFDENDCQYFMPIGNRPVDTKKVNV
jgi:hypothetical protein